MFLNIYIFFHLQFLSFNLITRTSPAADVKRKKKTDNATLKLNSGKGGGEGESRRRREERAVSQLRGIVQTSTKQIISFLSAFGPTPSISVHKYTNYNINVKRRESI